MGAGVHICTSARPRHGEVVVVDLGQWAGGWARIGGWVSRWVGEWVGRWVGGQSRAGRWAGR